MEPDTSVEPESEVAAAIRKTIHDITATGPFTIVKAAKVRRISLTSVPLLRALSDALAGYYEEEHARAVAPDLMGDNLPSEQWPLAPSPPAETYATNAIREVIAALPRVLAMQHQNPSELVRAIALAENTGMPGLAVKLRRQLGIESPEEPTKPEFAFPGLSVYDLHKATGEVPQGNNPTLASDSVKAEAESSPVAVSCLDTTKADIGYATEAAACNSLSAADDKPALAPGSLWYESINLRPLA